MEYILIMTLLLIFIGNIVAAFYYSVHKEVGSKHICLPLAYTIYDKILFKHYVQKAKLINARKITMRKVNYPDMRNEYSMKISLAIIILCIACAVGTIAALSQSQTILSIDRPEYGNDNKTVKLKLEYEGDEKAKEDIEVSVAARAMSQEEFLLLCEEISEYLLEAIKGENVGLDCVNSKLNLVDSYPNNSGIVIEWITDEEGLIDRNGNVQHIAYGKNVPVKITAIIMLGEYSAMRDINITLTNNEQEKYETIEEYVNDYISQQSEDSNDVFLPQKYKDMQISFKSVKDSSKVINLVLTAIVVGIVIICFKDRRMIEHANRLQESIDDEYINLVSSFIVLLKSGLATMNAWNKIAEDNEGILYELMKRTTHEISNGVDSKMAIKKFGNRCQSEQYTRFVTFLIQNMDKGTNQVLHVFELEIDKARREYRNMKFRKGERASTKLVFPMVGLMIMIMGVVVVPALMSI